MKACIPRNTQKRGKVRKYLQADKLIAVIPFESSLLKKKKMEIETAKKTEEEKKKYRIREFPSDSMIKIKPDEAAKVIKSWLHEGED